MTNEWMSGENTLTVFCYFLDDCSIFIGSFNVNYDKDDAHNVDFI